MNAVEIDQIATAIRPNSTAIGLYAIAFPPISVAKTGVAILKRVDQPLAAGKLTGVRGREQIKENKAADPTQISFLGAQTVMASP